MNTIKWLMVLLLLPMLAFSQQTLLYTGQQLTLSYVGEHVQMPTSIDGQIVLASPLAPNQAGQVVTPVSFAFTNIGALSSGYDEPQSNYPSVVGQFSFDTQNGVIIAWHITVSGTSTWASDSVRVDSDSGDVLYEYARNEAYCGGGVAAECNTYQSTSTTAGTWSVPQSQVATDIATQQARIVQLDREDNALYADLKHEIQVCKK